MKPHYYLMRCKKLLRLEEEVSFDSLPLNIKQHIFDSSEILGLDQEQANWRVVIFRDEIMELAEYEAWLSSPGALAAEDDEFELIAN